MINRRDFLGITVGAGATLALTPELLRALQQQQGKLIQRAIPSSGELLPVVGLSRGNITIDPSGLEAVFKTLVDNGGRVVDMVHGGGSAEQSAGAIASKLGIQDRIFWSTKVSAPRPPFGTLKPTVDMATANTHIEASFTRLGVPTIDLIHVRPFDDVPGYLAALRAMKKAGRVRYIGVTAAFSNQHAQLADIMRSEPLDFVSVDYAIDNRAVEQTILPLARERKIAVMANFPFGGNSGPNQTIVNRLFKRTAITPLPAWAAEFDAKSWAQFFLKYVISNPAITAVRAGTEKPHHMLDNIEGGIGRLPNDAMRKRMVQFIDALPEVADTAQQAPPSMPIAKAVLDRYVGEYTAAGILLAFRHDGTRLFVKPGTDSDIPLIARSETRFTAGPIAIEFQVDAQGKVTGAMLEEGPRRTTLERR